MTCALTDSMRAIPTSQFLFCCRLFSAIVESAKAISG